MGVVGEGTEVGRGRSGIEEILVELIKKVSADIKTSASIVN